MVAQPPDTLRWFRREGRIGGAFKSTATKETSAASRNGATGEEESGRKLKGLESLHPQHTHSIAFCAPRGRGITSFFFAAPRRGDCRIPKETPANWEISLKICHDSLYSVHGCTPLVSGRAGNLARHVTGRTVLAASQLDGGSSMADHRLAAGKGQIGRQQRDLTAWRTGAPQEVHLIDQPGQSAVARGDRAIGAAELAAARRHHRHDCCMSAELVDRQRFPRQRAARMLLRPAACNADTTAHREPGIRLGNSTARSRVGSTDQSMPAYGGLLRDSRLVPPTKQREDATFCRTIAEDPAKKTAVRCHVYPAITLLAESGAEHACLA